MKYILIFCSFFHYVVINAQSNCDQDSIKYLIAYNYVMNDSINQRKSISVSDSIVDLDRFWFSRDLITLPVEKEKLDKYRTDKKYIWFDPFYSSCIDSLFCKNHKQSGSVLFFSMIEDNMLRADLLPYKRHFDKFNYEEIAHQTEGQIYLFIYCKNGKLKATFSHEIIYD